MQSDTGTPNMALWMVEAEASEDTAHHLLANKCFAEV
jgi:hypothetical protein